jgi:small-conductance mechanosensitive channel
MPEKPDPLIDMSDKTTKLEAKLLAVMAKLDAADTDREQLRKAIRDTDAEAMANANARREALLKANATLDAVETSVGPKPNPADPCEDSDLESVASGFFDGKKESRQDFRIRESAAGSQTPKQRMHKLIEERKKAEKPSNRSWKIFVKLRQEMTGSTQTAKADKDFLQTFSKSKWMRASASTQNGGKSAGVNQ